MMLDSPLSVSQWLYHPPYPEQELCRRLYLQSTSTILISPLQASYYNNKYIIPQYISNGTPHNQQTVVIFYLAVTSTLFDWVTTQGLLFYLPILVSMAISKKMQKSVLKKQKWKNRNGCRRHTVCNLWLLWLPTAHSPFDHIWLIY
jgi:hypothetical protein